MQNLIRFIILFILFISEFSGYASAQQYNIPLQVKQFAETNNAYKDPEYFYKWGKYKVFKVHFIDNKHLYARVKYILYTPKEIRFATKTEQTTIYNKFISNKNKHDKQYCKIVHALQKDINKVTYAHENAEPPGVPSVVTKYANKYLPIEEKASIIYLMEWNDYHVYSILWFDGFKEIRGSIILYNGIEIRRPTKKEYIELKEPIYEAYRSYTIKLLKNISNKRKSNKN